MDARVARIADALITRGQTLAVVECTLGGALGAALTEVVGASSWFLGGVAPYSYRAQERFLGTRGRVSADTARTFARAARERLGADWCLAETGIAGPRGQHRSVKDPGTAYLALLGPHGELHERALSTGLDDRAANRGAIFDAALDLLTRHISKNLEAP